MPGTITTPLEDHWIQKVKQELHDNISRTWEYLENVDAESIRGMEVLIF